MPTLKPRLLVTLEPDLYKKVTTIARTNGVTLSLAARDLIREACEDIEEWGLVRLAKERLKTLPKKRLLSHKDFWKKALRPG